MNLQKAEQAVKNAQNQLDEAMRQLEAAKDPWNHHEPVGCSWLIANTGGGVPAVSVYGKVAFFHRGGREVSHHNEKYLASIGWRYAEKGEVSISW